MLDEVLVGDGGGGMGILLFIYLLGSCVDSSSRVKDKVLIFSSVVMIGELIFFMLSGSKYALIDGIIFLGNLCLCNCFVWF